MNTEVVKTISKVAVATAASILAIGGREQILNVVREEKRAILNQPMKEIYLVEKKNQIKNSKTPTKTVGEILKEQRNALINTATLGVATLGEYGIKQAQRASMDQLYSAGSRAVQDIKGK